MYLYTTCLCTMRKNASILPKCTKYLGINWKNHPLLSTKFKIVPLGTIHNRRQFSSYKIGAGGRGEETPKKMS